MLSRVQQKAEDDAAQLLSTMRKTDPSLASAPVDPIRIARKLGINVRLAPMKAGASGAFIRVAGKASILLNASDFANRQRFTCAHEIGHYMAALDNGDADVDILDWRDQRASRGTDPAERYANSFAAALLMPAEDLAKHSKPRSAALLAAIFSVSTEAMSNRLNNLGM